MTKACRDQFVKFAGDVFDAADVERIVDDVAKKARARMDKPGADTSRSITEIIDEMTVEELKEFAVRKHMAAHDKRADVERGVRWNGLDAQSDTQRLQAMNVGTGLDRAGNQGGLDQRSRELHRGWLQGMFTDLEEAGVMPLLKQKAFRRADDALGRDIFIEISRINNGSDAPTGNKDAVKIAEILAPYLERARLSQNEVGAFIGKIDGYVTAQDHDMLKVAGGFFKGTDLNVLNPNRKANSQARRKAAQKQWRDTILPLLHERTFAGVKDRTAFLDNVWANIITGNHERVNGTALDGALKDVAPSVGKASLARRVSQERVLHFKSAADAWTYKQAYSKGTVIENIVRQLDLAARNTELMRVYGPNPQAKFEAMLAGIRGNAKSFDRVESVLHFNRRQAEFDQITGVASSTENVRLSTFVNAVKTLQVVSKLGGMTLSSMGDNTFAAQTLRRAGVPLLNGYSSLFGGLSRLEGSVRREVGELLGVNVRVIAGAQIQRYAASDGAGGVLNRASTSFYKVNLFNFWQTGIRNGVGASLGKFIGTMADKSWGRLPAETRATFESYGIDKTLWQAVRGSASDVDGLDMGRLLTPDMVGRTPAEKLAAWGKAQGLTNGPAIAREAELRFGMFYNDIADRAMTEPKARERALLRFGSKKGTVWGALVETMLQFKSFPLTVLTQQIIPGFKGTAGLNSMASVAHMIVGATILGYFAMQSKQLAKGKTLREMSGETVMAAFLQGGGGGIYGDFFFADYNRYGGGFLDTALGPTAGSMTEFAGMTRALFTEDRVGPKALRFAKGHTPFANLFYTQAALDYLVLFQMQEWVNPGSLERMEKRMERERGQRYIIPPSGS